MKYTSLRYTLRDHNMSGPVCTFDVQASCQHYTYEQLVTLFVDHCKKWCFQKERGEKTGYEHFQGRVSLKVKARVTTARKLFPRCNVTVTSSCNRDNNFYVTKDDTRIDGPWSDETCNIASHIPRQIRDIPALHPWQQAICDSRHVFDTRTIDVIVDKVGCIGKSTISLWIDVYGLGCCLPYMTCHKDLMRAVCDMPKASLYLVDVPRAVRDEQLEGFFSALEDIKNGKVYDDRYRFRKSFFDSPRIWVFTNREPPLSLLSRDRWRFWSVNSETNELVPRSAEHSAPETLSESLRDSSFPTGEHVIEYEDFDESDNVGPM